MTLDRRGLVTGGAGKISREDRTKRLSASMMKKKASGRNTERSRSKFRQAES